MAIYVGPKAGLRTQSIFIRLRVQSILASPSSSSNSQIYVFEGQVRVRFILASPSSSSEI